MQYEDLRQLCADPRARAAVLADMDSIGKEAQVSLFCSYLAYSNILSK